MLSSRSRFRAPAIAGVLVALIAAPLVVAPSAAQAKVAATATALPGSFGAMVVDAATGHVFVSSYDANAISVLDFSGRVVKTISGEAGARGMALVGSDLYVVASTAGAIDDISTTSLTRTRTLTSGLSGLTTIVSAAGALWVTSAGMLVKVSTADGSQTPYANPRTNATALVSDPVDTNTIWAFTPDESGITILRLDLSVSPPVATATQTTSISNSQDVGVSPDGAHLVPAGGAPYEFDEFNATTLALTGVVYPANPYPRAVAMTAAAGGRLAGGMNGIYDQDVIVYRLGDPSTRLATYDFGSTAATVVPGGLAFSPDGLKLFAVTADKKFHVMTGSGTGSGPGTAPKPAKLTLTPAAIKFGKQRVGTFGRPGTVTISNNTTSPVVLKKLTLAGADHLSFFGVTNCFPHGHPRTLAVGASCKAALRFSPIRFGKRHAILRVYDNAPGSPQTMKLGGSGTEGYFLAGAHGEVGNFGDAVFHGNAAHLSLKAPIISLATTPNGAGYWLLGLDGGIFAFGNAKFHGSTGAMHLNQPIVAMYPTPNGKGYWLVARDGGIFTFGNAKFHGSTASLGLTAPIVGMASTLNGKGYWLVTGNGGVYAFGNAHNYGGASAHPLSAPVVQIVPTPTGKGYWLVTADGHLFGFGDAKVHGSAIGQPIVGLASTADGRGYWEVSRTGTVYAYGDAHAHGGLPRGITDVIGIAATAPALPPLLVPFAKASARASVIAGSGGREARVDLAG